MSECEYNWLSRKADPPVRCAKCKSASWFDGKDHRCAGGAMPGSFQLAKLNSTWFQAYMRTQEDQSLISGAIDEIDRHLLGPDVHEPERASMLATRNYLEMVGHFDVWQRDANVNSVQM